ncbi:MAG: hypothetical protein ACE5HC_15705, partial [Candidatus Binatia bacterium]
MRSGILVGSDVGHHGGSGEALGSSTVPEIKLRKLEKEYYPWEDAVHGAKSPKIFEGCDGCFLYDPQGTPFLDLQMASATAGFGYGNRRL